jgi:glutathione S-transferase
MTHNGNAARNGKNRSSWQNSVVRGTLVLIRAVANNLPILYSFRRCPYAIRARMALAVSGLRCELREITLRDKPDALLAASPKGTVPVLVLAGGAVIDESRDIMRWALAQNDPEGWLGHDESLIRENDGPFKAALDRYKYPDRHGIHDVSVPRATAFSFLEKLEKIQRTGTTLADIAILPFVRQFAAIDPDWFADQPIPAVQKWLHEMTSTPLFQIVMQPVPRWQPGQEVQLFPAT